jgi:hypothetical protein
MLVAIPNKKLRQKYEEELEKMNNMSLADTLTDGDYSDV